jgi:hypothetical protein
MKPATNVETIGESENENANEKPLATKQNEYVL